MLFNNHENCDSKQRFGIRKLSVGVCSVLLSTLFLTMNSPQVVRANKINTGTGAKTEETEVVATPPTGGTKSSDDSKTTETTSETQNQENITSNSNDSAASEKTDEPKTESKSSEKQEDGNKNTTDKTINWGNHRFIMDWDWQTHDNNYWNDRIKKEVMPWVLKENHNEGASFKSWKWTSQGTYDGDNWTPQIDNNQGFCYPSGTLVVENPNGTSQTTYTNVTINIARSIASYFRCKYKIVDTENTVQTPVNDNYAPNTYITVHANSTESNFSGSINKELLNYIRVGGWTYGVVNVGDGAAFGTEGQPDPYKKEYLMSLITKISLSGANLTEVKKTNAGFAITFTDKSVLQGNKATLNVVGGVAQTGLTVAKDSDFTFKYQNATSGITTDSQNNIAKWQPTYEWVDKDGNAIGPSNPYNTSANFDAYVKINYNLDGKADGFQIVKVPVTISTTEHVNIKISGNGTQTVTYKGSAFNSSNIDPNNFKPSFTVTDGKAIPTPTAGNELTSADYDIHGDPTNVGSYDVYLNANGIAKVKKWNNANLHIWSNETSAKVGTFTIEKAKPTVTFNGKGSKTYNGQPLSDSDYTTPIGLSYENAAGMGTNTISLTAGTDYVWKKGDKTYTAAPSDVGNYTIELTTAGKNKIKGSTINSANLDWANATIKTAADTSYVINQADTKVNFEGNNNSSKPTYNGSAVSMPSLDTLKGLMSATTNVTDHNVDFSKLTAADFDWLSTPTATEAMKSAPINAGTYYIKLNSKCLNDLKAQNPNYKITLGKNLYKFTINSKVTFEFVDDDKNSEVVGNPQSQGITLGATSTITPALAVPDNYALANTQPDITLVDGKLPTEYTLATNAGNTKTVKIHLVHKTDVTNDSKTTTYKVIESFNGTDTIVVDESATFTRTATKDLVTNEVTYGEWKGNSVNVDAKDVSKPGYTAHTSDVTLTDGTTVPAYAITADSKDKTITVTYTANEQNVNIKFVDDDKNGAQVGSVTTETGTTDASKTFTLDLPTNYVLVNGQQGISLVNGKVNVQYKFTSASDQSITIHLKHATKQVDSTTTDIPEAIQNELKKDITRTIEYSGLTDKQLSEIPADQNGAQTVHFKGSGTYDLVDQKIIGNINWTAGEPASYDGFTPKAFAGYTSTIKIDGQPATSIGEFKPNVDSANQTVTIDYKADAQSVNIKFVDDQKDGAQVGTTITKNGVTDQNIQLGLTIPENYKLAEGQTLPTNYTFKATGNDPFVIHLVHKTDVKNDSNTVTYKVIKSFNGTDTTVVNEKATFNRTATKDLVTGKVTYGDWTGNSVNVDAKDVSKPGYTAHASEGTLTNGTTVPAYTITSDSKDKTITVTYTANEQSVTINFEDSDDNNKVVGSASESGVTDQTITEFTNAQSKLTELEAKGYKLAEGSKIPASYTFQASENGPIVIKLVHNTTEISQATNKGANIAGTSATLQDAITNADVSKTVTRTINVTKPGENQSTTVETQNVKFKQSAIVDMVTGKVKNYTGWKNADTTTTWTEYTPETVSGYTPIIKIDGIVKDSVNKVTPTVDTPNSTVDITYTATATAKLSGKASSTYNGSAISWDDVNSTTDGNNIKVTVTGPTAEDHTFTLGDGQVEFSSNGTNWSTDLPTNADTYQIRLTEKGKKAIKDTFGNNSITWGDITSDATYTIKKADATVTFTKNNQTAQDVKYAGSSQFDPSKFVPTISTNNDQSIPVTANLTISDFDFYNGTVKLDAEPTAVGNYTVKLNANGLAKLQTESTLNNYNWTNNTSAIYVIGKQTGVSVTISNVENGQSKVYKGSVYTNADLNPADFKVTLGNGIEVTLNDDKYWQFVPDQDPTNVGNYKVELSQAGKDYIASQQSGSYEYNFGSTGYGNFAITKATPTVVFNGVGSKTFGQNNTQWSTPTGLTITAPSNPTIALVAEDYEFVGSDGTVYSSIPTNVGTYKVRLSAKGKQLIAGSEINKNNLDWVNAKISGEGTFTVNAVEGKAVLSGSNSRDYNGSAVTTTDINNGGNIVVSISIPGTDKTVSYKLQDGDYTWKDNANTTNVGTYTIELNKANILAHLQDEIKNNKDWNGNVTLADADLSGTASFEVKIKAATVSLNGDDTANGPRYNGSAVSTPLDKLKNALSSNDTVNGEKLDLIDVTADGFDWYDASGKKLDSAPTDHGVYTIKLNDNGLSQIQTKNPNYKLSIDKNAYAFKINTAKGSVKFTGSHEAKFGTTDSSFSKDYKVGLTTDPATINGLTPSFTLEDKYLEFSTDGKTWSTTVPTAVGSYKVKLTDAARDRIVKDNGVNGNVEWPATNFSGIGKYIVIPAQATASLSGSAKRPYNGSTVTTADINNADSTIDVTINLPNNKTTTYKLVDGDYKWTKGSAPTNVGTYELSFNLTDQGKKNLQDWLNQTNVAGLGLDNKPNVLAPTEVTGNASFEITPVAITVTESGSGNKTYDGNAAKVTVTDLTNNSNWSATGMIGGQSFSVPEGLTLSDFDWYQVNVDDSESKLTEAPIDAGNYALKLNADVLKKLQDANKNYSFTAVSGQYGYTIKKAVGKAEFGGNGTKTYNGSAIDNYKPTVSITAPGTATSIDLTAGTDYVWYKLDENGHKTGSEIKTAPINAGNYVVELTDAGKGQITSLNSANIDWSAENAISGTGSYIINKATATVNFADGSGQTVDYTGQTGKFDASKFIPDISTNNDQTLSIPSGVSLSLTAGDFTINGAVVTTEPTALGTYTIGLSDTGFEKLQSATDNYNWVNNANATYAIRQNASSTVTLNGNQNATYTGSDFTNDDIDVSKFTLTLPEGMKSYTLQKGDLEFVSGNPTTVGSYQVRLSKQGQENINKFDSNFSFDFNKDGVVLSNATFTITKATPSVTFHGEGSKTFAQNDTNWTTNIDLTITAPGTTNATIALANGDYQFVLNSDHSVTSTTIPTNVGEYTIELTDQGKKKINNAQGTNLNSANLDWANAKISGTGTFTVKAAEASAKLSGSNSRDYNSSAVTTTDINKGGNIVVSISIPGTDKTVSYTLQDGDYTWTKGTDPINQGDYTLELNKAKVLAHLQAQIDKDSAWKGNVTIADTALSGNATFTIKKVNTSAQLQNGDTRKYNGSSTSISDVLSQLQNGKNWNASGFVNNEKLDTSTITVDGFDWYEADGTTKLTEDPKNVGKYVIKLNSKGISELQNANGNYTFTPNGQFTYEITKASGTVTFSGDHTITYGQSDPDYYKQYSLSFTTDPTISGYNPSYEIKAGNLQFSTDGQGWNDKVPTTKGTYQVRLDPSILANLDNAANIDWSQTGTGTYIINAATATAELSGKNHMTYSGDAATANDVNGGTIEVTLNFPGVTDTNKVFKLTDESYYTWNTVGGKAPKDAGKYTITLTGEGKTALQKYIDGITKGNVTLPSVSGSAEFDIDAKAITVTQGRSDHKNYDGKAASANINDVIAGISASSTAANHPLNVPTTGENALNAADFDWWNGTTDLGKVSDKNVAPTNAGSYSIKLNADGLQKLQNANKNYSFSSVEKQYGYTINKATATVSISGTQDSSWTGSSIAIDPSKFPAKITANNGLTLNIPTGVTLEAGDYEYVDANGNTIAAPSELGQYKVRLTENGWKKLQSQTDNYTWSYDNSEGTVNINKATATVTLNGSGSVKYTGNPAQIPYDGSYTVTLSNGKTYTLQAGDLEFVDKSAGANTNVGTYQVKLSNNILTHLGADSSVDPTHYTYELAKDNTADLKVTPAEATATISGNVNEAYKGSAYDVTTGTYNGNYTVALTVNGQSYVLKAGDYNYVDADGNVLTELPKDVGTYKIGLTDQGKQAIEALTKVAGTDVNNYNWKFASDATFTITAKDIEISVTGEASKHYDGKDASVDADQLKNISLNWNNSSTAPNGINFTLKANDLEVVDADGKPVKNVNFENGQMTKKYYIRLTQDAINTIKGKSKNYNIIIPTIDQAKTNALYTIYARKAGLTVNGKQDVIYGSPEQLNLGKFTVSIDKDSWVGGTEIPTITLQNGDLRIVLDGADSYPDKPQYETAKHNLPINVGSYTVKITKQLIDRLEKDPAFKDYDFGDDSLETASRDPQDAKDITHNPTVYVVNPKELGILVNGKQIIKYGESDALKIKDSQDSEGYEISFTGNVSRDNDIFDGFKLQASDLQFVGNKPNDAGNYYVTLSSSGLKRLQEWGQSKDSHFVDNYIWPESFGQAPFEVVQMPVTITIGNAQGTHGQSVVYGQPTTIDNNKYSISVETEDGKTLEYNLQAGDLQFVTDPTNVGKYQVELSAAGLKNIEDKFGTTNYTYTSDGKGDFEVTAATANITLTGHKESTYNGKTPSLKASDYQLTGLPEGVNFTLQDGDLTFVDADGKPLEKQPVDASATPYRVGLTQAAKDRLKADEVGKNYEWKLDQSKATYTINKATATVSFKDDQDSQTEPYTGETGKFDPSKFVPTISTGNEIPTPDVPTDLNLSIADGDFEFTKDGVSQTTEPTGQGTYNVKLTAKGMQKIYGENTTNYDWTNSAVGTYTINAISISVSGQGNQDVTYDGTAFGNADKLDLSKFVPTLNAGTVVVPEIPVGTLTADDYTIKNSKGETVTDPTNSGEYTVWLNENGLKKLKDLSSNFTWPTDPIKVGTLNIAQTDATAKLSGSNSKTYDGDPVSTKDINKAGGNITIQVTVNGKTYDYALQDGDYTWANGEAPTNVGEYTDKIVLDTTGTLISHLTEFINGQNKDLEGNFKIDANNLTGSASFSITPKDATVTQGGSDDTKTYNGTAGSVTLDQLINNLTSNDLVSGQNLNTSGLTLDDFAWSGTDPNHIAAGDYTISLTEAGLAKLQKDNPNYKLSTTGSFKYKINQATASAELSGSGEKTYNGDPVSDTDIQKADQDNNITVKVTIPGVKNPQTVTLGVNDFDWSGGKVPTVAGTYTITLNDAGKAAIKQQFADNKNIDWTKTSFTGSATYTIKKADGTISFTGSDSKDFDNKEVLPSDLDGNKFYVTINGQQIALPENGYEIVDADGKKVTPKDAGTYYIVLTDQGLADLEKDTNYSWTPNWNGTTRPNQIGTFVINQTKVTPTISGTNDKTYNGLPTKLAEVTKDGKIKVTVDSGNTESIIPDYILTAGDYDWYGADGNKISAPTVVGKYIIKLSTQGLQNIQAYLDKTYGKNNVALDTTKNGGQADFDINPFEITVTINGSVTVDAGTTTIPDGKYSFDFVPTKNDTELPNGWKKPTILASDLEFDGQKPTAETKNGTFTVNYKGGRKALQKLLGDNYKVTYVAGKDNYIVEAQAQSVEIKFVDDDKDGKVITTITKAGVTGQKIDLNLTVPKNYELAKDQTLPKDYTFKADGNDPIVIHLVHKKQTSQESKTITRTIEVHLPSGEVKKIEQKVEFTRTATTDLINGDVAYSDWTTSTDKWDKFVPDAIDGYTADPSEVPEETVTVETKDTKVEIHYNENTQPTQPTEPEQPTVPSKPTTPGESSVPTTPVEPDKPGKPTQPSQATTPEKPSKPNKPTRPNKPSNSGKPEKQKPNKPNKPAKKHETTAKPNNYHSDVRPNAADYPAGTHWEGDKLVGPHGEIYYERGHVTRVGRLVKQLPQTGSHDNHAAGVLGAIAAGLGLIGLGGSRKKKKDED